MSSTGRPPYEPTDKDRQQVWLMTAAGIPQTQVARALGMDSKTLRKHFRRELDSALDEANMKVAGSLFKKATGSGPQSVTAAIFWLKTRAGWRDPNLHEHAGPGGKASIPVQATHHVDFSKLPLEVLLAIETAVVDGGAGDPADEPPGA